MVTYHNNINYNIMSMVCLCSSKPVKHNYRLKHKETERQRKTKTILIVDYDPLTSRVFKLIFRKRGFIVDTAKDGEEAKEKMKNKTYQAALISFVLPDMNGIDLLIFTTRSMPNAAKIVTTGFPNLRDGIKFIEAGADAYFSKPVKPEELVFVVEEKLASPRKVSKTPSTRMSSGVASNSNKERKDLLN